MVTRRACAGADRIGCSPVPPSAWPTTSTSTRRWSASASSPSPSSAVSPSRCTWPDGCSSQNKAPSSRSPRSCWPVNESADRPRRSLDIDIEYLLNHFHPRGHTMRLRPDATRWTGSSSTTANLRVSDVERNEVADKLSRHFSDGRLDQVEFKERLDATMSAKTQGDLPGLFDDLPRLDV